MKKTRIFVFTTLIFLILCGKAQAAQSTITVYFSKERGGINNKIFGNNILGYKGNYGFGVWDAKWNKPVGNAVNLMKDANVSVLRFPGALGANKYNWKKAVGKDRNGYLFGIDEYMDLCEQVNAEPMFTLPYFAGDENDAADLVEYLNATSGSNPNRGTDWGKTRAENGHASPYDFKYFEIGNEIYHEKFKNLAIAAPDEYGRGCVKYYDAMKRVDPSIKIGISLSGVSPKWDKAVLEVVKSKMDFGVLHMYPTPVWGEKVSSIPSRRIFSESLAQPIAKYSAMIEETQDLISRYAGKKVPISINEYNGGFAQEEPVPYRFCMGTALINAEMLFMFMSHGNDILTANNWNLCNEYWGMIANGFDGTYKTLHNPYYKRPNYYVFEMYAKHFGDVLIKADVKCNSYTYKNEQIPYLSVNVSRDKEGEKIYLMVINKNMDSSETATIYLKDFIVDSTANAWILNGPSVDATNEKDHDNVKVTNKKFVIKEDSFKFTFEPHSFTAIEIERAKN